MDTRDLARASPGARTGARWRVPVITAALVVLLLSVAVPFVYPWLVHHGVIG